MNSSEKSNGENVSEDTKKNQQLGGSDGGDEEPRGHKIGYKKMID